MIDTSFHIAADTRDTAPSLQPAVAARLLADARRAASGALTAELIAPLGDYRRAMADITRHTPYQLFSEAARKAQARLIAIGGADGFAAAHALLMIEAIEAFHDRAPADGYPDSIRARFGRSFARILAKIAAGDWTGYDAPGDLLWKDFGLAYQRLLPGGARVIEPEAWLPRSLPLRGGVAQAAHAARLLAAGHGPYLKLHTHDYELDEFNADGWRALMRRVADLLRQRPALKGVFVGGWLYDPALPAVSPRLAFHRELTIPNGAETFRYARDGADSLAFAKSETRRRLYAEGRYRPEQHILVWRRAPLLAWADAQSA